MGGVFCFFGGGGEGGWENIIDRCGLVGVSGVGWGWVGVSGLVALFDNAH